MIRFAMLAVVLGLLSVPVAHATPEDASWYRQWLDSPWPVRYVIVAASNYENRIMTARDSNADSHGSEYRAYEDLFDPVFPLKDEPFAKQKLGLYEYDAGWDFSYDMFGFQVIEFAPDGKVLTPNRSPLPLMARQNYVNYGQQRAAMLVAGEGKPGDYWYMLGLWFDGFPSGEGGDFSPVFCHPEWDDDGSFNPDAYGRYTYIYGRKQVETNIGLFGCREWTYQLYRRPAAMGLQEHPPGPPYINVTTYGGKRGEKTRIGNFLGWAWFDDPRRPVIGKHGKYWLCLHECPDGEKPGLIPDIKAWTAKRGWPLPKPTPTFPDSKFKSLNKPEEIKRGRSE